MCIGKDSKLRENIEIQKTSLKQSFYKTVKQRPLGIFYFIAFICQTFINLFL